MIGFKNLLNFAMLAVVFVFFPSENWDYWFNEGKADRVAEFCFKSKQHCYVVAKNLLGKPVRLGFTSVKSGWASSIGSTTSEDLKDYKIIPANSYSLIEVEPNVYTGSVVHSVETEESFSPKTLMLVAPVEQDRWIFFVLGVVVAAALLTHSIGGLVREDDRQKTETRTDYSWHYRK
jgi:hypothetical protein